jgi:hypothetical protein
VGASALFADQVVGFAPGAMMTPLLTDVAHGDPLEAGVAARAAEAYRCLHERLTDAALGIVYHRYDHHVRGLEVIAPSNEGFGRGPERDVFPGGVRPDVLQEVLGGDRGTVGAEHGYRQELQHGGGWLVEDPNLVLGRCGWQALDLGSVHRHRGIFLDPRIERRDQCVRHGRSNGLVEADDKVVVGGPVSSDDGVGVKLRDDGDGDELRQ